jgi:hypothetical protein
MDIAVRTCLVAVFWLFVKRGLQATAVGALHLM